jgi:creatinine amidohydrolase/Fe(II)-dependent formamide hydrolase-like protein
VIERSLTHLTWTDIRDLDKTKGVLLLPIGAIEQHGPHLPVATDTLLVTNVLKRALQLLPQEVAAWRLPALSYGKSNEHEAFPGTISLTGETLLAVLKDVARSVARAGFRRLAFVNGHGGNSALLEVAARDIRAETGLMVFCIQPAFWIEPPFEISEQEKRLGIHAGELETSLVLALQPGIVKMDKAVKHYMKPPMSLFGSVSVAWLTTDWSKTGVFGDATKGTAEKGVALLDAASERLAKLIEQLSKFEVPNA